MYTKEFATSEVALIRHAVAAREKRLVLEESALAGTARPATVRRLYTLLDVAVSVQQEARAALIRLGRRYPESRRFMQSPGLGEVSAPVSDAFIQTPHRIAPKQKLWRY